jgi:hypothetical protein
VTVETAREGFVVSIVRTVTNADDVRTLRLKSVYRPSRNVTLVGAGGAAATTPSTAQNRPVGERTSE